ncbi:MAG: gliding motility-associated C-terminal domain-containing protein, partial [Owenweeksia sp.]
KPGANPSSIEIAYEGQDGMKLVYGNLLIQNSVENVMESKPYAYQLINGKEVEVNCSYVLRNDTVSFALGKYNTSYELVIDPTLIFSTYSGSTFSNFGYTATFSADGSAYGGGTVFGQGSFYPIKMGFQSFKGDSDTIYKTDIGISKFTGDGTTLIYSTYLGGDGSEMPYSLLEAQNGDLIIVGNTGSHDFPLDALNAFQPDLSTGKAYNYIFELGYEDGVDFFMARLSADGSNLIGSTYLGDTNHDGVNKILHNSGDKFRGGVAEDSQGNIYAVGNTDSPNFPGANTADGGYRGKQDGVIFSFNSDFSQLNWSRYYGGSENDVLITLNLVNDTLLYVAGFTASDSLSIPGSNPYQDSLSGDYDGWILALSTTSGNPVYMTYNGTPQRDGNFLLDFDLDGNIYVFGQSRGIYPVIGNNTYSVSGAHTFIQMFSPDLVQSTRSMTFGNPASPRPNISPTGLMVDDCFNVYVSGWGGGNNNLNTYGGTTNNMFVTPNAFQPTTDGADFYMMVLDASWQKINYATYFGERGNNDHVDGGTSRFRRDGTIFHAACTGCATAGNGGGTNSFPTTAGAYATSNGALKHDNDGVNNCNLAVFKFQMESNITIADVLISKDSACIPYTSNLTNLSYNADFVLLEHPDGSRDTLGNSLSINSVGQFVYRFIAIDTTCGLSDTLTHTFTGISDSAQTNFAIDYDSCSADMTVKLNDLSVNVASYLWDFGDGGFSQENNPEHTYAEPGEYLIKLYGESPQCGLEDSIKKKVSVRSFSEKNEFRTTYDPCGEEAALKASFTGKGDGFHVINWFINDSLVQGGNSNSLNIRFPKGGVYEVRLESKDTICNRTDSYAEVLEVKAFVAEVPYRVPNVFTPNGDGSNDLLQVVKNYPFTSEGFNFQVFNRWGIELFNAGDDLTAWDGTFEGKEVPQGVYYYLLSYYDECGESREEKGFLHLFR